MTNVLDINEVKAYNLNNQAINESFENAEMQNILEPIPFRKEPQEPMEFPIKALGDLKNVAIAIHNKIQAPFSMCCQSILSAVNLAVQPYANIKTIGDGAIKPISLFFISIAESGERKSSCDNIVLKALKDYERQEGKKYNEELKEYLSKQKIYESEKNRILKSKASQDDKEKKLLELKEPKKPLTRNIICSDPTIEGLIKMMQNNYPSMGLFLDEGGIFINSFAMNKDNKVRSIATFSKLWDGSAIDRTRASEETIKLYGKRFALHIMIQPYIIEKFLNNSEVKSQGILSRMLIAKPKGTSGERFLGKKRNLKNESSNDDVVINNFNIRVEKILNRKLPVNNCNELEPPVIELEEDAKDFLILFYDDIEGKLGKDGKYKIISGLANKSCEIALRIATTIALYEDIEVKTINLEQIKRAISIMIFYLDEALRLNENSCGDKNLVKAENVWEYISTKYKEKFISPVEIYQNGIAGIKTSKDAKRIMNILEEHNYLIPQYEDIEILGHKRKEAYLINRQSKID